MGIGRLFLIGALSVCPKRERVLLIADTVVEVR